MLQYRWLCSHWTLNVEKWKCLFLFIWTLDLRCLNKGMRKRKFVCLHHSNERRMENEKGRKSRSDFLICIRLQSTVFKKHFYLSKRTNLAHFLCALFALHILCDIFISVDQLPPHLPPAEPGTERISSRFSYGSVHVYDRIELRLSLVMCVRITW